MLWFGVVNSVVNSAAVLSLFVWFVCCVLVGFGCLADLVGLVLFGFGFHCLVCLGYSYWFGVCFCVWLVAFGGFGGFRYLVWLFSC